MNLRAIVLAATMLAGAGAALAQTPLDISDASITQKPKPSAKQVKYPEYPSAARRQGLTGETRLRLCVDEKGHVAVTAIEAPSGTEMLDDAAVKWLTEEAKFDPAEVDGKPVAVCNWLFTYVWSLPHKPSQDSIDGFTTYSSMIEAYRPRIVSKAAQAAYPESSRAAGVSGLVRVELCIGVDGKVAALYSDPVGGDDALVKATLGMALSSTYAPGRRGTKPAVVCGLPFEHTWVLPQ